VLRQSADRDVVASLSLAEARARQGEAMAADDYYGRMEADGHDYGPSFRAIAELYRSDGAAMARVTLPEMLRETAGEYRMHPVLADAAMQVIGAAIAPTEGGPEAGTYIPVSLDRFAARPRARGVTQAWSVVTLRPLDASADAFVADVNVFDEGGEHLAIVAGVCLKRADASKLRQAQSADEWLHEVVWQDAAAAPEAERIAQGAWVIVSGGGALSEAIASRLADAGGSPFILALAGENSRSADGRRFGVRANAPEDFLAAFSNVVEHAGPVAGIVHVANANAEAVSADPESAEAELRGTATLLHTVRALLDSHETPAARLWVVTRGAQAVGDAPTAAGLRQSPAIGLARTIAAEYPSTRTVCVDLDPPGTGDEAADVWREILSPGDEPQVAIRDGRRLVMRLVRTKSGDAGGPVELTFAEPGVLDRLTLRPAVRRAPAAGEVEVEVLATGLNFRDVLNALGMYEGPPGPLGAECVGRIVSIGPGVTGVSPGDRVLTMWPDTFRSFVTLPAVAVFPVPANLSVEDAATIPVAFMTAEYALNHLAAMRPGDRVLIHAAAGGVGLAAVQLAQRAGAEIFATAGSPAKRAYLESLGVRHILSSRSLEFADELMAMTGGTGVDIVLNSLAGEFIERSLGVLRSGGRFLELGKSGIWTAERVAGIRPDVAYHAIYLGEAEAPIVAELFPSLLARFERGELRPLPHREFRLTDAVSAFRFMAQARHIGKIVVVHDRAQAGSSGELRADATYLVTGAFGGLGPMVARWLVDRGARHLVLIGRQAPSGAADAVVDALRSSGARVEVMAADVSREDEVRRVFAAIDASMPPLRGIVHAAGVIADGPLAGQDWSRFERVLAPKAAGGWALHRASEGRPLDFFVLFSSMVAIFGGAGQANYAAANAGLDALAHYRRAQGLPALSVNWGPWAEAGMAARLDAREHRRWAQQGIGSMKPAQALAALERLLASGAAQGAVLPIDWNVMARSWAGGAGPALVRELVRVRPIAAAVAASPVVTLQEELAREIPSERVAAVRRRIVQDALRILGISGRTAIEPRQPLSELGLDSLMAVELRNALGVAVGRTLPATLLFRYPTVEALTQFLAQEILGLGKPDADRPSPDVAQADAARDEVAALEDEEVKRLLNEELELLSLRTDES
jgi:NADPH:quinone reductase-like Zn-dependent oxidoreductase/acyl carrier protein